MRIMPKRDTGSKAVRGMRSRKRTEAAVCYAMIAPQLIGFFLLTLYPILWTFRWSFYSYNGIPSYTRFIGLENFKTMFTTDFTYWKMWGQTILFVVAKVPLEIIFSMILALILSRGLKGSNFFRTAYYMPVVISTVIVGVMFSNMFSYFGWVNGILNKLGMESVDWFANRWTALAVLVISSIWNTFGTNVMYFLAALTNVPKELYECAKLDGASPAKTFFKITLPMIASMFQVILLLSLLGTLSVNEAILALTGGGPTGQTYTIMSYLTKQFVPGFTESTNPALGYGCAMSLVTTVLFAIIGILYNQLSKKKNDVI